MNGIKTFFGEEKTGVARGSFAKKKILFILENPVIQSSIMYIQSSIPYIQSRGSVAEVEVGLVRVGDGFLVLAGEALDLGGEAELFPELDGGKVIALVLVHPGDAVLVADARVDGEGVLPLVEVFVNLCGSFARNKVAFYAAGKSWRYIAARHGNRMGARASFQAYHHGAFRFIRRMEACRYSP